MTDSHIEHSSDRAPFRRLAFGSGLSALVGWSTLNVFVLAAGAIGALIRTRPSTNPWWIGSAITAPYSAALIFATWLFILLPLYVLVPRRSVLWWWPICTLCGAISGALIMFAFFRTSYLAGIIMATGTGAVTCLFGSLTAHRYHHA